MKGKCMYYDIMFLDADVFKQNVRSSLQEKLGLLLDYNALEKGVMIKIIYIRLYD